MSEVRGDSAISDAVLGITTADGRAGVAGVCDSANGNGVYGRSNQANGVIGFSMSNGSFGVAGINDVGTIGAGVYGHSDKATGGLFVSIEGEGVRGTTNNPNHGGVVGVNNGSGFGVYGESTQGNGVSGVSHSANAAVAAVNVAGGLGLWAESKGGTQLAAHFQGNVEIAGDLTILNGKDIRLADFAEDFDHSDEAEIGPGSVVVLNDKGAVHESKIAYDRKVAGVVSGAGNFRPAITLDRQPSPEKRTPVALMGKVYCKVDSQYAAIEVGDLLTTSPTRGFAMKAMDRDQAFGAVIGKALAPLRGGLGLIPILIALQ
jgi:hypothetical protein